MNVIDLHCDTVLRLLSGRTLLEDGAGHVSLSKLRRGGVLGQCFAIFVPFDRPDAHEKIPGTARDFLKKACDAYHKALDDCGGELVPVTGAEQLRALGDEGKIGAILTVENAVSLDGELSELDVYDEMGVKMCGITWNFENSLGYPNSPDREAHLRGLKPFGIEAVRRMNELRIAVDVSHLSEGGFWDVARHSARPFIASHSCARALCDVPRNLTDEQLRAVADSGGLVGVNYYSAFISGRPENATDASEVVRHLRYMADAAGTDVLALGSDYDGMDSALSWTDCGGQQELVRAMEASFSPAEIEKITHENALRVFREIWGK